MDAALIASATLLGLAGTPHCTAMCSAPCTAAVGRGGWASSVAFHVARTAGYAAGGAVVAASVAALAGWSQLSPALRPVWTLVHALAVALGLWLVWRGSQPAWMSRLGRVPPAEAQAGGWQRISGPTRAAAVGSLWVAWPCGLLQSALLVASMAGSAAGGAAAMAGFALASAPALALGPWAWRRLLGPGAGVDASAVAARERLATRAAGGLLVAASGWALGHGLWHQVAAYCGLH